MFIILHVIIALLSIVSATSSLIKPTKAKLRASYRLVGATIFSGTYLVISTHTNLLSACLAGLAYLSCLSALIAASYHLKTVAYH